MALYKRMIIYYIYTYIHKLNVIRLNVIYYNIGLLFLNRIVVFFPRYNVQLKRLRTFMFFLRIVTKLFYNNLIIIYPFTRYEWR